MLAKGDHSASLAAEHDTPGDEPFEAEDPSSPPPVGSEEEFTAILDCLVADFAPRVFAVVQEYGARVDGRIAAWGIAFDDRAEVVSVDDGLTMSLPTPHNALCHFAWGSHITPRLVWVNPAASSAEHSEHLGPLLSFVPADHSAESEHDLPSHEAANHTGETAKSYLE